MTTDTLWGRLDKFAHDINPDITVETGDRMGAYLHQWIYPNGTRVEVTQVEGERDTNVFTVTIRPSFMAKAISQHQLATQAVIKHRTVREFIKDYITKAASIDKNRNK